MSHMFKVGDRVKIVKVSMTLGLWTMSMDKTVGKEGLVSYIYTVGAVVVSIDGGGTWAYPTDAFVLASSTPSAKEFAEKNAGAVFETGPQWNGASKGFRMRVIGYDGGGYKNVLAVVVRPPNAPGYLVGTSWRKIESIPWSFVVPTPSDLHAMLFTTEDFSNIEKDYMLVSGGQTKTIQKKREIPPWPHVCRCGSPALETAFTVDCKAKCVQPMRAVPKPVLRGQWGG